MPDWIVKAVNTSALAGVCLFGMWAIVAIARFLGPKLTRFFEAHVTLIDSLRTNLQSLTDFSERQIGMLDKQDGRLEEIQNQTGRLAQVQSDLKDIRRTLHGRGKEHPGDNPGRWPTPAELEEREKRQS